MVLGAEVVPNGPGGDGGVNVRFQGRVWLAEGFGSAARLGETSPGVQAGPSGVEWRWR